MREDEIVEKIIETNGDVKWIRAEIAGIKEDDKELERRVAAIEVLHPPSRTGIISERVGRNSSRCREYCGHDSPSPRRIAPRTPGAYSPLPPST
jgi:hypothetical protein